LLEEQGESCLFVFRHFPLQKIHPVAFMAATAAEAAGEQHRFWEMHDIIFENQKRLLAGKFTEFAKSIELDMEQFLLDMESVTINKKIENDFESGIRSGVNGTPTFYINGLLLPYDTTYDSLVIAMENAK
jgi:protein-disulfide isomerase